MLKILKKFNKKICLVIGTRPSIVMFSPIIRTFKKSGLDFFVIHTGQHYSYNMDKKFFEDLNLPEPEYKLNDVKNCKFHGEQTARMLGGIEKILLKEKPKIVLVGGDANCNLAGALAARKLHIKVGHVEAGERSYDWRMPEEHNRRMIDHISEYLFVTNEKSKQNLLKENVLGKIFITGNPIVDAAYQNREIAKEKSDILKQWNLKEKDYFILTTHREENVDSKENLQNIILGMKNVCGKFGKEIIFLAHPRTQKRIEQFGLTNLVNSIHNFIVKDAVGYLDFINLLSHALLVFTDSGGVQQEACIFKIPCVTLRKNTEWTETIELGANILAGTDPEKILEAARKMLGIERNWANPFGDGKAAERIVEIVSNKLQVRGKD